MNGLAVMYLWASVQVTLVAAAAAGLYALVSRRRGPASTLTYLCPIVLLLVTIVAFCPIPADWNWSIILPEQSLTANGSQLAERETPEARSALYTDDTASATGASVGALASWIARFPISFGQATDGAALDSAAYRRPFAVIVGVMLAASTFGLVYLLLGLWSVTRSVARSKPINDQSLNALLAELCDQLGVRQAVAVRECPESPGPATLGWRRPVILLPAAWPTWSRQELRAVLAHELAHVRHRDFAAWMLAQLTLALHFYHPLVHWLARRLHDEQEFAADARAAGLVGGSEKYLSLLAHVSLRMDEKRWAIGTVPTLFQHKRSLIRRIDMLGAWKPSETYSGRGVRLRLSAVALMLVALGVSGIRNPVAGLTDDQPQTKPQNAPSETSKTPSTQQFSPFNLSYVPADAFGFVAFRPSFIANEPAISSGFQEFLLQMTMGNHSTEGRSDYDVLEQIMEDEFGIKPGFLLPMSEIDQVVMPILTTQSKSADGQVNGNAVGLLGAMIRIREAFDWREHILAHVEGVEEQGEWLVTELNQFMTLVAEITDERSLAICSADTWDKYNGQPRAEAEPVLGEQGRQAADSSWLAVGINVKRAADLTSTNEKVDPATKAAFEQLYKHASSATFGVRGVSPMQLSLVLDCDSPVASVEVESAVGALLGIARKDWNQEHAALAEKAKTTADKDEARRTTLAANALAEILRDCQIRRVGDAVVIESTSALRLADLIPQSSVR